MAVDSRTDNMADQKAGIQTTISPYTQKPVCTRPLLSDAELDVVLSDAVKAQKAWKKVSLDERIAIAEKWLVRQSTWHLSSAEVSGRIREDD